MEKKLFRSVYKECTAALGNIEGALGKLSKGSLRRSNDFEEVKTTAYTLRESLRDFNKTRRLADVRELIADCEYIHNRAQSALDLIGVGELSPDEVPEIKKLCMSRLIKVRVGMTELSAGDIPQRKQTVEEIFEHGSVDIRRLLHDPRLEGEINELKRWRTHLPPGSHSMKQKALKKYLPVIAITSKPMSKDALREAGFSVQILGNYPVLHNQLVLALNPRTIRDSGHDLDEYAMSTLEALRRKEGKKLLPVSEEPASHPAAQGIQFYW